MSHETEPCDCFSIERLLLQRRVEVKPFAVGQSVFGTPIGQLHVARWGQRIAISQLGIASQRSLVILARGEFVVFRPMLVEQHLAALPMSGGEIGISFQDRSETRLPVVRVSLGADLQRGVQFVGRPRDGKSLRLAGSQSGGREAENQQSGDDRRRSRNHLSFSPADCCDMIERPFCL